MSGEFNQRYWRWIPTFLICALIWGLSDIPNLHLAQRYQVLVPAWVWNKFTPYSFQIGNEGFFSYVAGFDPNFIFHKLGHIVAFSTLSVSLYFALQRRFWRTILVAFILACSDELHQYFVAGRSCRFFDILLDTITAFFTTAIIAKNFKRSESDYADKE